MIIDAETLVPEFTIHSLSSSIPKPMIIVPAVIKSGFIFPIPSSSDHVVIPLEEKLATFARLESSDPMPITFVKSPGLFKVP